MFFGTMNNKSNGRSSINTRLYPAYSENSLLTITAWNQNLSVKIFPSKGTKNEKGLTDYYSEEGTYANFTINTSNGIILSREIDERIIPAYKESKKESVSIVSTSSNGEKKILTVFTDNGELACSVVTKVNEDGSAEESNVFTHIFTPREYLFNYDYKTGKREENLFPADFEVFRERINKIGNLIPDIAHSINYNKMVRDSYFNSNSKNNYNNNNHGEEFSANVNSFDGNDVRDFIPFT